LIACLPSLKHLIAQRDIEFSNCMIEAVMDYNNRPHNILSGLAPAEVLQGARINPLSILAD